MNPQPPVSEEDPNQPVAYDPYGRPLYTRPQTTVQPQSPSVAPDSATVAPQDAGGQPQVVYMTRAIDPHKQLISEEVQKRHDEAVRQHPQLNLSEGEYVISAIKRHPIGLISLWSVIVVAIIVVLFVVPALFASISGTLGIHMSTGMAFNGVVILLLLAVLLVLGGVAGTFIYEANRFYLTNESITQHIQNSLFSKKNQTISLGNVEDASYRQRGLLQTILNYGSIRLSTEGEETTYRFNFVADPQRQISLLNDAVEGFKNFRSVDPDES